MVVRLLFLLTTLFTCSNTYSGEQVPISYKFDFGDGRAQPGFLPISPQSVYSTEKGYGFMFDSKVVAGGVSGKRMQDSYLASSAPVYFSVKLPEGNYEVTVWLGSRKEASSTVIRAECRRLMEEKVITKPGQIVSKTFIVHVKDSLIRSDDGRVVSNVKLKPREKDYLHWDNLLTLEINDTLAKVAGIEIRHVSTIPVIFLAGNSTVVDQDKEPWASWGQMIPTMLDKNIVVANYAESGETMKAFKGERRLEKIWSLAKPGDYLFMEFGHNDQKPGGNHLDPYTTYTSTLKEWILECKKRRITPVLVTPVNRRRFDSTGKIINTLDEYPNAKRKLAAEEGVLLIDLHEMSKQVYEALGIVGSTKAFVHFLANTFPDQTEKLEDNTHFSTYGAYLLARCVAYSLAFQKTDLANHIRREYSIFQPQNPIPFSSFYLPLGRLVKAVKPDGN